MEKELENNLEKEDLSAEKSEIIDNDNASNDEVVKEINNSRQNVKVRKKKKKRNKILLIIDFFILLVVIYFVIGYFNFFNISKDKKPIFQAEINQYDHLSGNVTVHDYKIYKIVKYEIPNQSVSYSMKLWFMDDIK